MLHLTVHLCNGTNRPNKPLWIIGALSVPLGTHLGLQALGESCPVCSECSCWAQEACSVLSRCFPLPKAILQYSRLTSPANFPPLHWRGGALSYWRILLPLSSFKMDLKRWAEAWCQAAVVDVNTRICSSAALGLQQKATCFSGDALRSVLLDYLG